VDVSALKDSAGNVGLIGVSSAQTLDCGILVAECSKELEWELCTIEWLKGKLFNCL